MPLINLEQFIREERPLWDELEKMLTRFEERARGRLSLEEIQRFQYLYSVPGRLWPGS